MIDGGSRIVQLDATSESGEVGWLPFGFWLALFFQQGGLFELVDQIGDLASAPRTEVLEGDACASPPVEDGDVASDAKLHLARHEIDFHVRAPLKIEGGGFDETSGEAQVKNSSLKEQRTLGNNDLGVAFAGVAGMVATISTEGIRWMSRHHR